MVIHPEIPRARHGRSGLVLAASFLLALGQTGQLAAETSPQVIRVEEEWEMVIATPDGNSDAPQVTCVISPVGNLHSIYAALEINHQSLPDFVPGGLQLQLWNNDEPLNSHKFPNGAVLDQPGETIRWTQTMNLSGGLLTFEIVQGTSVTWGNFGGQGYLKGAVPTSLTDLNGYNPTVSATNSGVSYAGNRVASLVLRRVRLVTASGQVLEAAPNLSVYPRQ